MDVLTLWNFRDPAESEARFRAAQDGAGEEDRRILETQIARTYGLRRDFSRAAEILAGIDLERAGAESRARWFLERGRCLVSMTHDPASITDEMRSEARVAYARAFELASAAGLHYIEIDALHMLAIVEIDPALQLERDLEAIRYMEESADDDGKKWAGSLYNNTGYALAELGRHDEADDLLRRALAVREAAGQRESIRIAWWMIAWNLRLRGDVDAALEIQKRSEAEFDAIGQPSKYVFEELAKLYEAKGDTAASLDYARRAASL